RALSEPRRPLVAIVAGSKVSTKLSILQALSEKVDQLVVGGGIANTFMLASGIPVGNSLVESDQVGNARAVIEKMKQRGAEVPIPVDVVCGKAISADAEAVLKDAGEVADDEMILDIGPRTAEQLAGILQKAG